MGVCGGRQVVRWGVTDSHLKAAESSSKTECSVDSAPGKVGNLGESHSSSMDR